MTVTTTYICDRCKNPQPTRLESEGHAPLWRVSILCEAVDQGKDKYHYPTRHQEAEWCLSCVDELKVRRPFIAADVKNPKTTIEDIIREIIQEQQYE